MTITVSFMGRPGDVMDELCERIIHEHGGKIVAGGVFAPTCERDVQAKLPPSRMLGCMRALRNRGFKVEEDDDD